MADKAPNEIETDDPETKLFRALNYFPTPPWASRAGAELIQRLDPLANSVLEPAAGMGHMAEPLASYFPHVRASDVHRYHADYPVADFLDPSTDFPPVDWVITNPPFARAAEFAARGLGIARRGVALLCRLSFIESVGRYGLMQRLSIFAPFAERVPMVLGRWDPEISTATSHAWFIWLQPFAPGLEVDAAAFRLPQIMIIPPGSRARLWRHDDPERFSTLVPMPLFGGGEPVDSSHNLAMAS